MNRLSSIFVTIVTILVITVVAKWAGRSAAEHQLSNAARRGEQSGSLQPAVPSWESSLDTSSLEMREGLRKTIVGVFPREAPLIRLKMSYPKSWLVREPIRPDIIFKLADPTIQFLLMARVPKLSDDQRAKFPRWTAALAGLPEATEAPEEVWGSLLPSDTAFVSAHRRTVDSQPALDLCCEAHMDLNGSKVFIIKRFFFVSYKDRMVTLEATVGGPQELVPEREVRKLYRAAAPLFGLIVATAIFPDRYEQ